MSYEQKIEELMKEIGKDIHPIMKKSKEGITIDIDGLEITLQPLKQFFYKEDNPDSKKSLANPYSLGLIAV